MEGALLHSRSGELVNRNKEASFHIGTGKAATPILVALPEPDELPPGCRHFPSQMSWCDIRAVLAKHFPPLNPSSVSTSCPGSSSRLGLRILEVGCGHGSLSYLMQICGHKVVAIDPSAAAITAARKNGVIDARQCCVEDLAALDEERERFDVVLFTRSLHHIGEDLEALLGLVRNKLLREGGLLVMEEFAREEVDRSTAEWYYGIHDALVATDVIAYPDALDEEEGRDVLLRWERQFEWSRHKMIGLEKLHPGRKMVEAVVETFGQVELHRRPALFRFIADHVDRRLKTRWNASHASEEDEQKSYRIARSVWAWEERMIHGHSKTVLPIGILVVAVKEHKNCLNRTREIHLPQ